MTWCSWLLIPAAALPLLMIPLIFVAHSSGSGSNTDGYDADEATMAILNEVNDSTRFSAADPYKNNNKATVLPDFQHNLISKENTTNTDLSSSLLGEKNGSDATVQAYEVEKSNSILAAEQDKNGRESYAAFSIIDNDSKLNPENKKNAQDMPYGLSASLASSNYSQKNVIQDQKSNKLLEDMLKPSSGLESTNNDHDDDDDKHSDFTSVSQRGVNPNYYNPPLPQQNYQNGPQTRQQPNYQAPYPQPSPNFPQQNGVNRNMNPQQRTMYPQSAGPDNSQAILQNNPNFLPNNGNMNARRANGRPHHNQYPYQQQPNNGFPRNNYGPTMPMNNTARYYPQNNQMPSSIPGGNSMHFKPAYKKRMANNNLPSATSFNAGGAYGFR